MKSVHSLKLALGQLNPIVGDLPGNSKKITSWIDQAESQNVDLLIFPELALNGYPVWDLANYDSFVSETKKTLTEIISFTRNKKVAVALGFIDRGSGKTNRNRNALAFFQNGKLLGITHKQLLPTYDVFLEQIFFEAGESSKVIRWNGLKLGFTVCEDIWDESYNLKPIQKLSRQGAELIINISASPYYQGVFERRKKLITNQSKLYKVPIIYVNQVGAQDDLLFDGRSFMTDSSGSIRFIAPAYKESLEIFNWPITQTPAHLSEHDIRNTYDALVMGIRDYCFKNKFSKVILGLSGGIDSALVAVLAADAIGPESVKAFSMPSPFSSKGSWEDSAKLAKNLGIEFEIHPIKKQFKQLRQTFQSYELKGKNKSSGISLAIENLQARLRGLELMYYSNHESRLLLSTGNKSELAVGYCTLYGDMCGGLAVLGDVYKTDVYKLCEYRNSIKPIIPKNILTKAPSAELRPNQKDQDSLPPYPILDSILKLYIEKGFSAKKIFQELKQKEITLQTILEIIRKVDHNEYKRRQTPPILRVTEKAWFGRRMPITNRFIQTGF